MPNEAAALIFGKVAIYALVVLIMFTFTSFIWLFVVRFLSIAWPIVFESHSDCKSIKIIQLISTLWSIGLTSIDLSFSTPIEMTIWYKTFFGLSTDNHKLPNCMRLNLLILFLGFVALQVYIEYER